jgi:hypothetical protein
MLMAQREGERTSGAQGRMASEKSPVGQVGSPAVQEA